MREGSRGERGPVRRKVQGKQRGVQPGCMHHSREGDRGRAIVSSWMYVIWAVGPGEGAGVSLNQLITSGRR